MRFYLRAINKCCCGLVGCGEGVWCLRESRRCLEVCMRANEFVGGACSLWKVVD